MLQADNPTGLERVRYELDQDGELLRTSWPIHISPREYDGKKLHLLKDVKAVHFEQLTDQNYFSPIWPPLNQDESRVRLPHMVKVTIEMKDGTSTWRLFPGTENNV